MKHLVALSSLLGALCLAAPATGWSKDKHHHDHDRGHSQSSRHYDRSHDHHHHYHGSSVYYRGYRPYYGGYGYYPYSYYSRPSIGFSIATGPGYSSARYEDVDDDLAADVQRALARRGFYRGEIDGDVGAGTRAAIRNYQYQHRLEVTGRIDRSLLRSLDLS